MFATAEERKYPFLFCKRLAKLVVAQLAPELNISGSKKAATEMQPRRGENEIVREYRCIALLHSTNNSIEEEFLSEAISVIHPFDRQIEIPPRVANVLHDTAKLPPYYLIQG
eukprot:1248576-Karenia_brevis.AAC.1